MQPRERADRADFRVGEGAYRRHMRHNRRPFADRYLAAKNSSVHTREKKRGNNTITSHTGFFLFGLARYSIDYTARRGLDRLTLARFA